MLAPLPCPHIPKILKLTLTWVAFRRAVWDRRELCEGKDSWAGVWVSSPVFHSFPRSLLPETCSHLFLRNFVLAPWSSVPVVPRALISQVNWWFCFLCLYTTSFPPVWLPLPISHLFDVIPPWAETMWIHEKDVTPSNIHLPESF